MLALETMFGHFAEQSLHCSIISRGKKKSHRNFAGQGTKALWFCGEKSALLHNFAGQSLHCSIILRGKDMDFRAKIQQQMRFSYFLKKYFNMWQFFQRSIAPWWPLFRKKINWRMVPLTLDIFGVHISIRKDYSFFLWRLDSKYE